MDFKQLSYFVTIVEEGTISRAAQTLNISQPPLSVSMQELEKELGCKLFERTPRRILLTDAGKLLYERSVPLLRSMKMTKDAVQDYGTNQTKSIRIGITSSAIASYASKALTAFLGDKEDLVLDISEADTYGLLEDLRKENIHFCIVRTPANISEFNQARLLPGKIMVAGLPQFINNEQISVEELGKKPLITYRRWQSIITQEFNSKNITPQIVCVNEDFRTSLMFAKEGLGVALLPISETSEVGSTLKCVDIDTDSWNTDVMVVWNKNVMLPDYVRDCIRFLIDFFK